MFTTWGNSGEMIVYNAVTTFCHHCINVVLQHLANHAPAVKIHWLNVVCHPWAIVLYNVGPTLDQRRNAIWVLVWVDNLIIAKNCIDDLNETKNLLGNSFQNN